MQQDLPPDQQIHAPPDDNQNRLLRARYEAPLGLAYAAFRILILDRYDTISAIADWYRNPYPTDKALVSTILDQSDTRIMKCMRDFRDKIFCYQQGRAPQKYIHELETLSLILVDLLSTLTSFNESIRHVRRGITRLHFILLQTERPNFSRSDYIAAVSNATDTIVSDFAKVSDDFRKQEDILLGKVPTSATKADFDDLRQAVKETAETVTKSVESIVSESAEQFSVAADQVSAAAEDVADAVTDIAKVAETVEKTAETTDRIDLKTNVIISKQEGIRLAVNRIDARGKGEKSDKRQRFTFRQQEHAVQCWLAAKTNQTLKDQSPCNRVTQRQAFDYYKKVLESVQIIEYNDFVKCLEAHKNRIQRKKKPSSSPG